MNRMKMLTQLETEIEAHLPSLGMWQMKGVALLVLSLLVQGKTKPPPATNCHVRVDGFIL